MMPFGRNLSLPLVVAVFALTASHATAQVYKCDTPNGIIYSQIPCAPDAGLLIPRSSSPSSKPALGNSGPRPSTAGNEIQTKSASPRVRRAAGITGFRDFQFGMSLSEAKAIDTLTFVYIKSDRGKRTELYDAGRVVAILGGYYNQSLFFDDEEGLTVMKLKRKSAADRTLCRKEFDVVFGSALARYRPSLPIQMPSPISSADFDQVDGSQFILSNNLPGPRSEIRCEIRLTYKPARGGSGS